MWVELGLIPKHIQVGKLQAYVPETEPLFSVIMYVVILLYTLV